MTIILRNEVPVEVESLPVLSQMGPIYSVIILRYNYFQNSYFPWD